MPSTVGKRLRSKVLSTLRVADDTFILRFERNGLEFEPGQHLIIGPAEIGDMREYSVFSSADDPFLEVLVREVPGGLVSGLLGRCREGDELTVEGPAGSFILPPAALDTERFLFVATGTGIAPFRSFVRSYPSLDYLLLHGVRSGGERFGHDAFSSRRLEFCTSRDDGGTYRGRVTAFLRERAALPPEPGAAAENTISAQRLCYLCGSSDMIYEAHAILSSRGIPRERIFAEIYY